MKKRTDLLLVVLIIIFVISVIFSGLKFFVFHSYTVFAETSCDPQTEACFVYECDPKAEECAGNPEEDISYYKLIRKNGANIPVCDPHQEECEELLCCHAEENCEEITCSEETLSEAGEGIYCSNPEDFQITEEEKGEEAVEGGAGEDESEGMPGSPETAPQSTPAITPVMPQ